MKPSQKCIDMVKQDVQLFNYIVEHKENYKAVYEDGWCAVLEVK